MESLPPALCFVETTVEAVTGVQAEEKQGKKVKEYEEGDGNDSIRVMSLSKVGNRRVVIRTLLVGENLCQ